MTLNAGSHLGSYRVVAPLGAGGMGPVYRVPGRQLGLRLEGGLALLDVAGGESRSLVTEGIGRGSYRRFARLTDGEDRKYTPTDGTGDVWLMTLDDSPQGVVR